ncbi:MAG TPA: hypothetical protein VKE72_06940 [Methylocella sp.]|nr:hypothetical protein [Methylocella sp.]
MNFRKIFVSFGCFAAAIGIGIGKPARADDFQSGNESVSSPDEPCAITRSGQTGGCERIGGHVRIDVMPRIPDSPRLGGRMASPVAVRSDDGTGPRGHLHLPGGLDDFEPIPR